MLPWFPISVINIRGDQNMRVDLKTEQHFLQQKKKSSTGNKVSFSVRSSIKRSILACIQIPFYSSFLNQNNILHNKYSIQRLFVAKPNLNKPIKEGLYIQCFKDFGDKLHCLCKK
uniref:Uncharacterized protein n=1 Tax=Anguilla anguilla TaxID=7936 RepID=A0A0E9WZY1_ANGAN